MAARVLNGFISGVRVVVEHVIAGVKRCRIVKDVLRLTKQGISDLVMEIACGLITSGWLVGIRCQLSTCRIYSTRLKTDNV